MVAVVAVLILVVVVAIGAVAWIVRRQRRSAQLREGFGPEYDRTMRVVGDRGRAESELQARQQRVEHLDLRPLALAEQTRFGDAWRVAQARFVDDPAAAIGDADRLIGEVMAARGYPVGQFEQRAADISVDHPQVVTHYRAGHAIAIAQAGGRATTEDLRQGMVHYGSLFAELLGVATTTAPPASPPARNGQRPASTVGTEARR
jgi:hypothetical protein